MPSDSEPPESADSEPPESPQRDEGRRKRRLERLESVIPEIIKRAVEIGVEKARESPDNVKQFVNDMKLPKEIAHYLLQQIDETKNGLFRVVAKEMRDFLEHTNFAGEMQKLLTTVQFEVNTTIRFTPNDGRDKKSKDRKPKDKDGGSEAEASGDESDDREGDEDASDDVRTTSLPKPEVKTAVRVHREDRDRPRRRNRPTS